ncbi:hypothetical protein [Streptomyces collinus]|uniref:hypothetical protein n=1 Tax=Streptomyces collinus TaxID=42684 RepID=UPI0036E0DFA4
MTRVRDIPVHDASRVRHVRVAPGEAAARAVPGPPDAPQPLTRTPAVIAATVPRAAGSAAGSVRDDTRVVGVEGRAGLRGHGLAADHPAGCP